MDVGQLRVIISAHDKDFNLKMDAAEARLKRFGAGTKDPKIKVDTSSAMKDINALGTKIASLGNKTIRITASGGGLNINSLAQSIARLGTSFLVIQGIEKSFTALKAATLDYNIVLQQSSIGLTNLLGGNKKAADDLLKSLEAFAMVTPFQLTDLVPFTNKLVAVGFAYKDILPTIKAVGEASAATGLGAEGMGRIIYALGQIKSAGKLAGTEVRQLTEANIPVLKYLADSYGVTTGKIQKMISDGLIPADKAIAAIRAGIMQTPKNGGFLGSLEAQSRTLPGALSNIADASKKILGGAFADTFGAISEIAVRIARIGTNKEFQAWAQSVGAWFGQGFGLARESVAMLWETLKALAPLAIGAMAAIGARALWLGATAMPGAIRGAIIALGALRAGFIATGAASVVMTGVIGVALAALATDFLGIRSILVDGWKNLVQSLARQYDKIAKFLNLEGGFEASVKVDLESGGALDQKFAGWKSSLQEKMKGLSLGSFGGGNLGGLFPEMPDFAKWGADANKAISQAEKRLSLDPTKDILGGTESADKKRKAAALKLQRDTLADSAQLNEELARQTKERFADMARAVEDSASRQIKALTGIRDAMQGMLGAMQESLAKFGVISSPLDAVIARLEKALDLGPRMAGIARTAVSTVNRLNEASASQQSEYLARALAARQRSDKLSGGDGSEPARAARLNAVGASTRGIDNRSFDSGLIQSVINRALNTPMGAMACARFVNSAMSTLGIGFKGSESAREMERQASRVARRIPLSQAGAGDLLVGPGDGPSGRHVGVGVGNGMFAMKNRDRHGRISRGNWDAAYDTSALAAGGRVPSYMKNAGGVGNAAALGGGNSAADFIKNTVAELQNLRLGKLTALPKSFGKPIADAEGYANRFAAQMYLADRATQTMLRNALGEKGFAKFAALLREAGNLTDALTNRLTANKAASDETRVLAQRGRLLGRENDPFAQLADERQHGKYRAADEGEYSQLADATLRTNLDAQTMAVRENQRALDGRRKVLEAGRAFVSDAAVDEAGYARAIEMRGKEVEYWNTAEVRSLLRRKSELEKFGRDSIAWAKNIRREFGPLAESFGFDVAGAEAAGRKAQRQAVQISKDVSAGAQSTLTGAGADYDFGKDDERRIAMARTRTEIDRQSASLKSQLALLSDSTLSNGELSRALETQADKLRELNRLKDAGYGNAAALAQEIAGGNEQNRVLEKRVALMKSLRENDAENRIGRGLQAAKAGVYASTDYGSAEQARRLKAAEVEADLQRRLEAGEFQRVLKAGNKTFTTPDYAALNRARVQAMDAYNTDASGTRDANGSSSRLGARNALADAELQLRLRQLDAAHRLSDIEKQRLTFAAEIEKRRGTNNEVTQEEIAANEKLLGIMQAQAGIDFSKQRESLRDQIDALGYREGRDRENFLLNRDLERNPNLDASQRDTLYGDTQVLASRKAIEEQARATREMFHSATSAGVSEGLLSGGRAGIAKFGETLQSMLMKRFQDMVTGQINGLLDRVLGGQGQGYQRGGIGGTPPIVAPAFMPPPVMAQRNDGGGLLGGIAGALGLGGDGPTLSAQTINVRGTTVTVNGGITGALGGAGSGSRPSGEQIGGLLLGFLG